MSNYVAKFDLKNKTGLDTLEFTIKTDLAIYIDKLKTTTVYSSKLGNIVLMML